MRFLRVLTLMVLSAITAEFLLGDQYLFGLAPAGQQAGQVVLYTFFYGGSAVLIREIARRRGSGWRTIVLLALAFGLVEEGLVTQSLFNPGYAGAHLLELGFVPALGIAVPWTLFVLTLHVVWSISSPIAVAEALWGGNRDPWLGRLGLVVVSTLAVLGAVAVAAFTYLSGHFLAHPAQLVTTVVLAALAVVAALRQRPRADRGRTRLLPALIVGLVLSSAYQLVDNALPHGTPAAVEVTVLVGLLVVTILVALRTPVDVLGLALGALTTYGWVGLRSAARVGVDGIVEQIVIVLAVAVMGVLAVRRSHPRATDVEAGNSGRQAQSAQ